MTCARCGKPLPPYAPSCPVCGAQNAFAGEAMPDAGWQPYPLSARGLRPIRGLGIAVTVALTAWLVVELLAFAVDVARISLINQALAGSPDHDALVRNDTLYGVTGVLQTLVLLVTAAVFVVWLFRARDNAEAATPTRHRRSKAWLVLGWIVPIVSWWFPKQVVDDIWLASDPATPLGGVDVRKARAPGLIYAWWTAWLIYSILGQIVGRLVIDAGTLHALRAAALVEVVATPVGVAAAVLVALVVRRIGGFQETRRASPVYAPRQVPEGPAVSRPPSW